MVTVNSHRRFVIKLYSSIIPYLLLVTFFSGRINEFKIDKLKAINNSPYNAVAVQFIDAYDTSKYSLTDFQQSILLFKKESKKHIWPWIFFNRFVSNKMGTISLSHKPANEAYFAKINGLDIYNESGALHDFYDIWRISLKMAKELGAPGIVVDPELYNNHRNYEMAYLAEQLGKPQAAVKQRLIAVGGELADIVNHEYPQAHLWFFLTGLSKPFPSPKPLASRDLMTISYIIEGILQEAQKKAMKLTVISGGEYNLGYCHENLPSFQASIKERNTQFQPLLATFPNLQLAGVVAPWDDAAKRTNFMTQGKCAKSVFKNLEDFKQPIQFLATTYKYVWIYGAAAAPYNHYDLRTAAIYNKALKEAMSGFQK
jgi:hypothetical protein